MLAFCPTCTNDLIMGVAPPDEEFPNGRFRLECRTCPFIYLIKKNESVYKRHYFKGKEVEDVLGGEEAWANAAQASVQCPREDCEGDRAYFRQVQLRSADEPMTEFYRCTACGNQWREQ